MSKKKNRGSASRKVKKKRSSILLLVIFLFLLLILIGIVGFGYVMNHTLNHIEKVDKAEEVWIAPEEAIKEIAELEDAESGGEAETRENTIDPETVEWTAPKEVVRKPKVKNILLIGQDARPGETRARSDSMILCSVNEDTREIILTSLMRDLYVPFPGDYRASRINHAFAWGGMSMLDQVIEDAFGVTIDGNVVVDFDGFIRVMDMIAPLEIELKDYEVGYMNRGTEWAMHTGVNSMNGEQLLTYARMRYAGQADWERTERQRRVLTQAFNKVKNLSLKELMDLAEAALPCVTTDLSNTDIMNYVYTVLTNRMAIGETYRLPVDGTYTAEIIWGMDVLVPDLEANSACLRQYIYGE